MILKPPLFAKPIHGHPLGPDGGLVGCWPFNEGAYNKDFNKVFDLSGNGNTGTLVADTHWVPGKFGPALSFDGTGDYIDLAALTGFSKSQGTVSVRARFSDASPAANSGWQIFSAYASNDNLLSLQFNSWHTPDQVIFRYDSEWEGYEDCESGINLADMKWHHFVGTWDITGVGEVKIYADGVFKDSNSHTDVITGTPNYNIGNQNDGLEEWEGQIDNVMIFDRALSASEIALLYREPFCMFEREPIELWSAATQGGAPAGIPILRRRRECA